MKDLEKFIANVRIALHQYYGEINPIGETGSTTSAPYAIFELPEEDGLQVRVYDFKKLLITNEQESSTIIIENRNLNIVSKCQQDLYNQHKEIIDLLCKI